MIALLCRLQKLTWFEDKSDGASKQVLSAEYNKCSWSLGHWFGQDIPGNVLAAFYFWHLHLEAISFRNVFWNEGSCIYQASHYCYGFPVQIVLTFALSLREDCLKEIFNISIESLRRLIGASFAPQESEVAHRRQMLLLSLSLDLVQQVLSFDFIGLLRQTMNHWQAVGTITDEASDGMNLIFAPTSWEEVFITHPMDVFFYIFENTQVPLPIKVCCVAMFVF